MDYGHLQSFCCIPRDRGNGKVHCRRTVAKTITTVFNSQVAVTSIRLEPRHCADPSMCLFCDLCAALILIIARRCKPFRCLAGKLSHKPSILAEVYLQLSQTSRTDCHPFLLQNGSLICRTRRMTSLHHQKEI
jgi:hypothetical protein